VRHTQLTGRRESAQVLEKCEEDKDEYTVCEAATTWSGRTEGHLLCCFTEQAGERDDSQEACDEGGSRTPW
jgi:hypothetical protein